MPSRRAAILACSSILLFLLVSYTLDLVPVKLTKDGSWSVNQPGAQVEISAIISQPTPAPPIASLEPGVFHPAIPEPNHPTTSPIPTQALSPTASTTPAAINVKQAYFNQAFSPTVSEEYPFIHLKEQCAKVKWEDDAPYLKCTGMSAGLTSIMSQLKVCFKMAVDTGSHLVLPAMPLRDSTDLKEFNFLNGDAYLTYDKWFDASHLISNFQRACPKIKIIHPDDLVGGGEGKAIGGTIDVKHRWEMPLTNAPGYSYLKSYFWTGRPFSVFFADELRKLREKEFLNPERDDTKKGLSVITIHSAFLIYRITDDPTRGDMRLWNDLGHLIRFNQEPRDISDVVLKKLEESGKGRGWYGVHFRVENDTIWSSLDHQLGVDLDALDKAWKMFGKEGQEKPMVFLACGDADQVEKFVSAGKERGWDVTHKWALLAHEPKVLTKLGELPFDFQGGVDLGLMIKSEFFLGITGSAFSSSIANARDVTGRYRGSSFLYGVEGDDGAKTHLFNDLDAESYACCL
ncbi:hypothetical protein BGZ60DRAFT_421100 [Tricladium varicosporioides]|nr:hypothetical protein BGZ60DRAFT_421100 [Hymenoscyphus varicosporioides]